MPGIVLYNRRWALGSDDILLPAAVLATLHITWWERKPLFAENFPFSWKKTFSTIICKSLFVQAGSVDSGASWCGA